MPFKSEIIKGASVDLSIYYLKIDEKSVGSYGMLWLCSQNTKNIKELRLGIFPMIQNAIRLLQRGCPTSQLLNGAI
jgi:hypothetical protein